MSSNSMNNNNASSIISNTAACNLQDGCYVVCESNVSDEVIVERGSSSETNNNNNNDRVVRIKFMTDPWGMWISRAARDFEAFKQGAVAVEIVETPWDQVIDNVVNEAISQTGLMDGFITAPGVSGSVVPHDGWADLKDFIAESQERTEDWTDIMLGYRKHIAQYQDEIIMFPLDGDLLSMFFRRDILDHFGLPVPRTWDEYSQVIQAVHGKTYDNQTLVGSCVGRSCGMSHWVNLPLSTITQTRGPSTGHNFDTKDMQILGGVALEQTLAWMEDHVRYAPDNEFDNCIELNADLMNTGQCVLTYNWGNSFKRYLEEGSVLRGDKFGVAPTPGSTRVLDRETMKMVDCDEERCPFATFYPDIGLVNRAPYLAYGGYACSVNNYTDPIHKRLATEFCAFAASSRESTKAVIPNATLYDETLNGQDPFRYSQTDGAAKDFFVRQGYEETATEDYVNAIRESMDSGNVVIDNRFPTASHLEIIYRKEATQYLKKVKDGLMEESDLVVQRRNVVRSIERQLKKIMDDYAALPTTQVSILESYQRLRGVYTPEMDYNYLGNIRIYGHVLVSLVLGSSLLSALWVMKYRKTRIVTASQPLFLVLISAGVAVLGLSIIPLGIDDESSGEDTCSRACMSIPWLLALGWTIVFSALFSKLNRINMVFKRAARFRRVAVTEKDVVHYFAMLLGINLVLLITWVFVAPLEWDRYEESKTESFGRCATSGPKAASITIIVSIAAVNGVALILANVAAYRARRIAVEYSESRYIGLAMLSILQVVMVGVPIIIIVEDNPGARYFMMTSIVFILCMSILLWVYVPKLIAWRMQRKDRGQRPLGSAPGLSFRLRESYWNSNQSMGEFHDYKFKLAALEAIMEENGIDATSLFKEAGLNSEFSSTPSAPSSSSKRNKKPSMIAEDEDEEEESPSPVPRMELVHGRSVGLGRIPSAEPVKEESASSSADKE